MNHTVITDAIQIWQKIFAVINLNGFKDITVSSKLVVSVVGAGGKSTTLQVLGKYAAEQGKKVLLTTSTHFGGVTEVMTNAKEIRQSLGQNNSGGVVIGAKLSEDNNRHGAFNAIEWQVAREAAEVIIIEADGSKRKPLKVPLGHEPVVYPETDIVLVLAGMTACDETMEQACFRKEKALEIINRVGQNLSTDALITPQIMATLLRCGYLENDKLLAWSQRIVVLLNQCDDFDKAVKANAVMSFLRHKNVMRTSFASQIQELTQEL